MFHVKHNQKSIQKSAQKYHFWAENFTRFEPCCQELFQIFLKIFLAPNSQIQKKTRRSGSNCYLNCSICWPNTSITFFISFKTFILRSSSNSRALSERAIRYAACALWSSKQSSSGVRFLKSAI